MARAGRPDEALDLLRLALRIDLDGSAKPGDGGLHLATIGGVWQALVQGFLGLSVAGDVLHADPRLPADWGSIQIRLRCLGARLTLSVAPDLLTIGTDRPIRVCPKGASPVQITGAVAFRRAGPYWQQ
jgi:trehalose/maltose hydrolase-like predicted phosphorylase